MPSTAGAAVRKRAAAGSALDDSTERGRRGIDPVLYIVANADQGTGRDGDEALVIKLAPDSPTAESPDLYFPRTAPPSHGQTEQPLGQRADFRLGDPGE
jgi:hypothetical protein